ncbi:MAG TPA: retropepsin-like aspartic protease [Burkholderiaceae bacterium]|nr:retropepsin-like aspartic protease [Burkholderiaceae bacterium]
MTTPEAAFGRLPLKGAPPAAWQSQIRGGRLGALIIFCTLALSGAASAQTVSMAGSIGDSKALLMINGAPHTLTVGNTVKGVTLKRVMPGQAEVEIGGKTVLVAMGGAPASVGGGGGGGATGREILIAAGPGGHFVTSGQINGKPVQLMVDTGATSVAISRGEAERLGIDWKSGQRGLSQTAGGVIATYGVQLTSVRIGDVEVFGVNAMILPTEMPFVLLGNSFLGRFTMRRDANVMKLEKRD